MCFGSCLGSDDHRRRPQRQGPYRSHNAQRSQSTQRREATRAAREYGWPREHSERGTRNYGQAGNRDSYLEPGLAEALVNLPGSEFRHVYDPERPRHPPQDQYHSQSPQYQYPDRHSHATRSEHIRLKQVPTGRGELNHDNVGPFRSMYGSVHGVVHEQPRRADTMTTTLRRTESRRSVDSNGVSDISSDDDGDSWGSGESRRWLAPTPPASTRGEHNLYDRTGHSYGRGGAF
ncbi:uncharacterized protein F4812DRAFT_307870 [Daldinia caldariorum]|uniref:uncharacterized protein n=1 Tax=Daldinia caldariorum TaxID=326644 RepID=UPI002007EF60|nr:uncharacterized protein F4812DRAFT_307870 [Daldinia caldariorum]KAI1469951.1 hypothetical protein F4812DRAFT_307870 [Daldinia caldariorum]